MTDVFDTEERSEIMRRVRSWDTKPELSIRRGLHAAGYRYRLHVKLLPGCPDIVLPRYRTAIQIRGCFWHGHSCRAGQKKPKSNSEYWNPKLERNRLRDTRNDRHLREQGWSLLVVWECECLSSKRLHRQLRRIHTHLQGRLR
ncbi:MAG: very short patch repair endonuclease [bacterium]